MPTYPYRIRDDVRDSIPAYSVTVLERYVNNGSDLSGFYFRLLSGDVFGAAWAADAENLAALGEILRLVAADFPGTCFGSPEAVDAWRGLKYQEEEEEQELDDLDLSDSRSLI